MSPSRRPSLFALPVSRPVGTLVILVTMVVVGVISYARLPLQMLPSGVQGSRFTVWISHPGSSAAENVDKVARPLEEQLRTLADVDNVYTTCRQGSVRLRVQFNSSGDLQLAKAELRDRIERARPEMPDSVERIRIWSSDDGDMPIMWFAVTVADGTPEEDIDRLIEQRIQRPLEATDGVSRAQIWGMLEDSVRILLDEERVKAARLDTGEVIRRLSADNFAKPLGEVTDGERRFLLRSDMRFQDLEEIEDYPIGNGLRLADVAEVARIKAAGERLTRIDGRYAYYGMIQKEGTANVVETSERIHDVIERIDADPALGGSFGVTIFFDQAEFIRSSLAQLESTAIWGGGLAILVLFAFLRRLRTTLVVALSIPISIPLALTWEHFSGGTFNVLTMTGLTLALGMLVDNSVVVIENIARLRARGLSPLRAAVAGVSDVGLAVALATLTSVVVFMPLIFMIGNNQMRVFLSAMGIPLCSALIASLLVALVFMPVLAGRAQGERPAFVRALERPLAAIVAVPVRALAHAVGLVRLAGWGLVWLVHRVERGVLALASPTRLLLLAGLAAAAWLGTQRAIEAERYRELAEEFGASAPMLAAPLTARLVALVLGAGLLLFGLPRWRRRPSAAPARPSPAAPAGTSVLAWIQTANQRLVGWTLDHRLLASLLALLALGSIVVPMGNMAATSFGQEEDLTEIEVDVELESNFTLAQASQEMRRYESALEGLRDELGFAHLVVRFWSGGGEVGVRWKDRLDKKELERHRNRLRAELPRYPGHRLRFGREQEVGSADKQVVEFQLIGPDADRLAELGSEALEILQRVEGLRDVRSPLEEAPEEIRLMFDREAAFSMGIAADGATRSVSWALRGAMLPRFQEEGREVPLLIEYDEEEMAGLDTLQDLSVWSDSGPVSLSSFATLGFEPGPRTIWRWNGLTTFTLQARIDDPSRLGERVKAGYDALEAELDLPRGFRLGRERSAYADALQQVREMQMALLFAAALVYIVMAILFESITLPLAVMVTVPFAVLGAMWTLLLTGTVMDSVGWIGIIILVGVVVNNGIVLIDKIHRSTVEDGLTRREAILEGATARVRPILMTALTTVFGLLPMATAKTSGEGIDYRALATCVAGGLALSTFFTLWMVPLAYSLADDLWQGMRGLGTRAFGSRSTASTGGAPLLGVQDRAES